MNLDEIMTSWRTARAVGDSEKMELARIVFEHEVAVGRYSHEEFGPYLHEMTAAAMCDFERRSQCQSEMRKS